MAKNGKIAPDTLADEAGRFTRPVTSPPTRERVVKHSQNFDRAMRYLTDDPTASKLRSLVRLVDGGDIAALCETQVELERKDAQFAGVVQTRRNAILALDWCIDPAPDHEDDAAAREAADYIETTLKGIAIWPQVLEHLTQALGPNVSVVEVLWDRAEVVDFVLVPCGRLTTHPFTNVGLAIKTDTEPLGFPVEALPGKFVVFQPYSRGGYPFRATLTHASLGLFLMGTLSRVDWLAFSELFGTPLRVGYFDDSSVPADREVAQEVLDNMSTDTAAMLPVGIKMDFLQAQGTGETYQNQLHYVDNKYAILWLGQTLTTDVVATGSYAAARVHNKVRSDLLASDLRGLCSCLREQLFRPMIALKYPERDMPVPVMRYETSVIEDIDSKKLRLEQLKFASEQSLPVPRRWLYDVLSIPRPGDEDVVELTPGQKLGFGEEPTDEAGKSEDAARKKNERGKEPEGLTGDKAGQ